MSMGSFGQFFNMFWHFVSILSWFPCSGLSNDVHVTDLRGKEVLETLCCVPS